MAALALIVSPLATVLNPLAQEELPLAVTAHWRVVHRHWPLAIRRQPTKVMPLDLDMPQKPMVLTPLQELKAMLRVLSQ